MACVHRRTSRVKTAETSISDREQQVPRPCGKRKHEDK